MKTVSLRIPDEIHVAVSMLAQMETRSINERIIQLVDKGIVEAVKGEPDCDLLREEIYQTLKGIEPEKRFSAVRELVVRMDAARESSR